MIPSHKLADMSTSHVTQKDSELLGSWVARPETPSFPLHVHNKSEWGWYIIVPPKDEFAETARDLRIAGISEAFITLLHYLSKHDFMLLCLDRDGEVEEDFLTFEW